MKNLFKNPLLYTNFLLIALVAVLAPHAAPSYAKAYSFVKNVFAAPGSITGEGVINYIANFVNASPSYQIGNSIIYDSGTNIGINTTSPGAKLDINAGTGAGDIAMGIDNTDDKFKIAATSDLSTNVWLTIDGTGNVGIGTANPGTKIDRKSTSLNS